MDSLHEGQMHFSASGGLTPGNTYEFEQKVFGLDFVYKNKRRVLCSV